jgi:hypothetical protein
MTQQLPFIYTIQDANNQYYYIDSNGLVALSLSIKPLEFAPDGWEDQLLNWERGFTYYGIIRAYSMENKFVGDGANILKYLYLTYGINAFGLVKVKRYNTLETILDYELVYKGELDFTQYSSEDNFAVCKIVEGGFLNELTAKESVDYEIDIDSNSNKKWVRMDGVELFGSFEYEIQIGGTTQFIPIANQPYLMLQMPYINHEGVVNLLTSQNQLIEETSIVASDVDNFFIYQGNASNNVLFSANNIDVNAIVSVLIGNVTNSTTVNYELILNQVDQNGNRTIAAFLDSGVVNVLGGLTGASNFNFSLQISDVPVTFNPRCKYQLGIRVTSSNAGQMTSQISIANTAPLFIKTKYRKPATFIPALPIKETLQQLLSKIAPTSTPTIVSSNLDTLNFSKLLTSGDAIRGLRDSKIKTNFNDLLVDIRNLFGIGMHYNSSSNQIIIEKLDGDIFADVELAYIGIVDNLSIAPANEFTFSKLKIGSPNQTYDDVNGKDEFNQTNQFTTPTKTAKSEKDFTTKLRTDSYGIEFTRLNLDGKSTTDSSSDNDTFMIDVVNTFSGTVADPITNVGSVNYYDVFRFTFPPAVATGLLSPTTVFNMRLSPKRVMYNNGSFIRSCMFGNDANYINFASGVKNTNVVIDDGANVYSESGDELISDFDAPFFIPIIFTFKTKNIQNIISLMNNPLGYLRFNYNDEDYFGFIIKVSDNVHQAREQEFKLLATSANDLNKLIYRNV